MKLALSFNSVRDVWFVRRDGMLFVLARKNSDSGTTEEREYMIVAQLGTHPNGWLIEPVDPKIHRLVHHSGFECAGSMCRTDADILDENGNATLNSLTPGRVHAIVHVVSNVNVGWEQPIARKDLEGLRASPNFVPGNLRERHPDEATDHCVGWYKLPRLNPIPNVCYVEGEERRACGLPHVTCIFPNRDGC